MDVEITETEKEIHKYYHCCGPHFFLYITVITMLVTFAGMTSGLTLGLMSMSQVDLEVIRKSGKRRDRFRACMYHNTHTHTNTHLFICSFLDSASKCCTAILIYIVVLGLNTHL